MNHQLLLVQGYQPNGTIKSFEAMNQDVKDLSAILF